MQLAHKPLRPTVLPAFKAEQSQPKAAAPDQFKMSSYVLDEINAYVAIRDIALAEAEKITTPVNLERVRIANEFVENCLKPARAPYGAQHLPAADAVRERMRCEAVKIRLALIQSHLSAVSREHAHAA
ncbi:MAG: hypothetical protein M3N12_05895 [Verrucomicrobiota bacterium]|nr:hypothetical protein [Verrucomicrobiota bacterium]